MFRWDDAGSVHVAGGRDRLNLSRPFTNGNGCSPPPVLPAGPAPLYGGSPKGGLDNFRHAPGIPTTPTGSLGRVSKVGRGPRTVAALASEPDPGRRTGNVVVAAALAREYNFGDVDGRLPLPLSADDV